MAGSICRSPCHMICCSCRTSLSFLFISAHSLSSTYLHRPPIRYRALRAGLNAENSKSGEAVDPVLLRKPLISPAPLPSPSSDKSGSMENEGFSEKLKDEEERGRSSNYKEKMDDWEDRILEDTVPLVGFVRMILHSGKYLSGDRLSADHEKTILERILPYHPEVEKKIGCGIDYITVGYHPVFERSRCLFIVRKDGEMVDFSYWKCIKGLIRKNYPLYADTFILRHFRRRGGGE